MEIPRSATITTVADPPTRTRHWVLFLTVIIYMITYMDRICIGHAAKDIRAEFGFDEVTIGWIFGAFNLSYFLFQIPGGWLGDRFGPRRILTAIVLWWSLFTAVTALAWGKWSMASFRFLFGVGEAGAFPTATRALSHWLPAAERGFAQGITHSGARLGAAITPPIVVLLITAMGWRSVFYIFGLIGVIWAFYWFWYYRDRPEQHRSVNEAELEVIREKQGSFTHSVKLSGDRVKVPWKQILSSRNLWMICLMYFCYAYSLWIYLTWYPTYLIDARGFSLIEMGFWHMVPLIAATIGDTVGGGYSDQLARRTGNLRMARRAVAIAGFIGAAVCIIPAAQTGDRYISVALTTLALFCLELTVGVSWAVAMDVGPEYAGSVSGFMNMCGNFGGFLASIATGYMIREWNWQIPFHVAAILCIIGAILYLSIDPNKKVFKYFEPSVTHS
ncbi:MAG: MFS transporter [Acidobacteria bacterium]|nr:MFS transporter [Acidobacteriota bacterium]